MNQRSVLKGMQIQKTIPYRDSEAFFALVGMDGNGKNAYMPVGESLLAHHVLLLGGAGSGKTNLLFHFLRNIRANLTEADVMVVFDPTGEYYQAFYQEGDYVFSDDRPDAGEGWNLFAELGEDDRVIEDAAGLCELLFAKYIQASPEPLYTTAARDLLMALIVYLYRQGGSELQNNLALRELVNDFDIESMREILQQETELRALSAYLGKADSYKTMAIIAALQRAVRGLFQGGFGQEGSQGIRPFVRNRGGKVAFIQYNAARSESLQPIYATLTDLCLQEVLSREGNEGNVYLFVDEAGILPQLPHLEDALLLGRSKGLRVMMAAAGIGRLEQAYGAAQLQSLLSAFGSKVAFQLYDSLGRNFIKSLYGRHRVVETFNSSVQVRGIIEQVADQYIIEDEDLTILQPGECIISTMNNPPFWFRAKLYENR